MSSAFPNAGGAVEDTQGSCMMERRLQWKFEWTEFSAVLAEGLLRLNGAGVELTETVLSLDDTGTFQAPGRDARWFDEAPRSVPYSS